MRNTCFIVLIFLSLATSHLFAQFDNSSFYPQLKSKESIQNNFLYALQDIDHLGDFLFPLAICDLSITVQPQSRVICNGQDLTLSVTASGTPPFYYQWKKGNTLISGATGSIYNIFSANPSDADIYKVHVTSSCGGQWSAAAQIVVNDSVIISLQPQSIYGCEGDVASLTVQADGGAPQYFVWYKDNEFFSNEQTIEFDNLNFENDGVYYAEISNACSSDFSNVVEVRVSSAPEFISNLEDVILCNNSQFTFTPEVEGSQPLSYTWYVNKGNGFEIIEAESSETFTISNLQETDEGDYQLKVANDCATIFSEVATLLINEPLMITKQPENINLCIEQDLTLSFNFTGDRPVEINWYKDNELLAYSDTVFTIDSVTLDNAGKYYAVISNTCDTLTTDTVDIVVETYPEILSISQNVDICEGSTFNVTVVATGSEPLEYQWFKDEIEIEGATDAVYFVEEATPENQGIYYVRVSNRCTGFVSSEVEVSVDSIPDIITQPVAGPFCEGDTVVISVVAGAASEYRWYKDNELLPFTTNEITLYQVNSEQAGTYQVVVSNNCGSNSSNEVLVEVYTKPEIISQTLNAGLCQGDSVLLTINTVGDVDHYVWVLGDTMIPTSENYYYAKEPGDYIVNVYGKCIAIIQSDTIHVGFGIAPVIEIQPENVETCVNSSAVFNVQATGQIDNFQWYFDGFPIPGAMQNSYTIPMTSYPDDLGQYYVVLSNNCGSVTSNIVNLIIDEQEPELNVQPLSEVVCAGENVEFSVQASGVNIQYQWYRNLISIEGATNNILSITDVQQNDDSEFYVLISNACNTLSSDTVELNVIDSPQIVSQPLDEILCLNSTLTYDVQTLGSDLSYQWYFEGFEIPAPDGTNPQFSKTEFNLSDIGEYYLMIYNSCDTIYSDTVTANIIPQISIENQPVSDTICFAGQTNLNIVVNGPVATYKWFNQFGEIPNSNLPAISVNEVGSYYAIVKGICNDSIISDTVTITMLSLPEITLQPLPQDICENENLQLLTEASGDNLSYQWYFNNMNIEGGNNPVYMLNEAGTDNVGNYYVQVFNQCGQVNSDTVEVNISSKPDLDNIFSNSIIYIADTFTLNVNPMGTPPFEYQWYKNDTLLNGSILNSFSLINAQYEDSGLYSVKITNQCGEETFDIANIEVRDSSRYDISGNLTYDNYYHSPLSEEYIELWDAERNLLKETVYTDALGYFEFNDMHIGKYKIIPQVSKPHGGINPTDGLLIMRNYVGIHDFDFLKSLAADVDGNSEIEPGDAFLVNQRYVRFIESFNVSDWLYNIDTINLIQDTVLDLKAVCAGDVDGSYIFAKRELYESFNTANYQKVNIESGKIIEIPIIINADASISAAGLKIRYNSGINVLEVTSSLPGMVYTINNSLIKIGWSSLKSYNFRKGTKIAVLRCMIDENVNVSDLFYMSSESNLADFNAKELGNDLYAMPKLVNHSYLSFTYNAYPNPFTSSTLISYTLPEDNNVKITITDMLGKEVMVLVDEFKETGNYNVEFNPGKLSKGVYYFNILSGNNAGTSKLLYVKQ